MIIQAAARICDNTSIHIAALIAHEAKIGNSSFIAHAVRVSGEVDIGDGVSVRTNASSIPQRTVGRWASVGAGSVVITNVREYATVVGSPDRQIKLAAPHYVDGDIFA